MTIFDVLVIALSIFSATIAMLRGFSRELFSLAAWAGSAYLAYKGYPWTINLLEHVTANHNLQKAIGLASIFIFSLIIISFITLWLSDIILTSFMGPIDRFLGLTYGLTRAILIMALACLLIGNIFEATNQPKWLSTSATYPFLYNIGKTIYTAIPTDALDLDQIFAVFKQKAEIAVKEAP